MRRGKRGGTKGRGEEKKRENERKEKGEKSLKMKRRKKGKNCMKTGACTVCAVDPSWPSKIIWEKL